MTDQRTVLDEAKELVEYWGRVEQDCLDVGMSNMADVAKALQTAAQECVDSDGNVSYSPEFLPHGALLSVDGWRYPRIELGLIKLTKADGSNLVIDVDDKVVYICHSNINPGGSTVVKAKSPVGSTRDVTEVRESPDKIIEMLAVAKAGRQRPSDPLHGLAKISVRNYRALGSIALDLGPVNLIFGPNGAGKSTLLDTLYFFRDCAIRGVEVASSERSHGIGVLWDGAEEDAGITIELRTGSIEYGLTFSLSAGRIEPFAGEKLRSSSREQTLIDRSAGSDNAFLYHSKIQQTVPVNLREPQKLSLGLFLDFNQSDEEAGYLDKLLHFIRLYHSRSFLLNRVKRRGSESSHETRLWPLGDNAWSVIRNLHDKRSVDGRYDTIMRYMAEAFPVFDGIVLEQTGPTSVYASFLEKGRRSAILASGVSDGFLQLLLLLTALFSEGRRSSVLLFDEPEVSLHPWALAVFAKAVKEAASQWSKQIFLATHAPVLISQFEPEDVLVAGIEDGSARFDRLDAIEDIRDLLKEYAAGSLYMSEAVAPQGASASFRGEE